MDDSTTTILHPFMVVHTEEQEHVELNQWPQHHHKSTRCLIKEID